MNVEKWTDAVLDRMRTIGDPEADDAVAKVDNIPGSVEQVSLFLANLIQNDTSILGRDAKVQIPPAITEFIKDHSTLPPWADPAKIALGQRVFMRHGPAALAALLCASLPECYSHKNGAEVLWYTQNLEEHTVRRVYQTARIVLDVMRPPEGNEPGGLDAGGAGVLGSVKTRLFHAAMRRLILTRPGPREAIPPPAARRSLSDHLLHSDWDEKELGTPINQEDSIFTLLTFSYVILRSWKLLGCKVSSEEREAYLHCWNVVGHLLGIPFELLPTSFEDAERGFKRLQEHQQEPSKHGTSMTRQLRKVMKKIVIDETIASHIDHTLMRYLMGDTTADLLQVPRPDLAGNVVTLGIQLWQLANDGIHALETIVKTITSHGGAPDDEESEIAVRIGQAITELLVAVLGRGEKGFDPGVIRDKASGVLQASSEASGSIKEQITPMLRADSALDAKHGIASKLGLSLVKILTARTEHPAAPRERASQSDGLEAAPPPGLIPPKKPYVMPERFKGGSWTS